MATVDRGDALFDRYEILDTLGGGGFADVYLAFDHVIERQVAIKVLHPSSRAYERALREARTTAALCHPNIVTIHDVIESDGAPHIVMEYIDGPTLRDVLNDWDRLTIDETIALLSQVSYAVEYAHIQGIVHLDLKPENIMILSDGKAKVADFGLARLAGTETDRDRLEGTVSYMAPELLRGETPDVRADVFSLGVVLYEALTGENPFRSRSSQVTAFKVQNATPPPPSEIVRGLDPRIDEIIERAMAKHPVHRFRSVVDMRRKAERLATEDTQPEHILRRLIDVDDDAPRRARRFRLPGLPLRGAMVRALASTSWAATFWFGARALATIDTAFTIAIAVCAIPLFFISPFLTILMLLLGLLVSITLYSPGAGMVFAALLLLAAPFVKNRWIPASAGLLAWPLPLLSLEFVFPVAVGLVFRPIEAALAGAVGGALIAAGSVLALGYSSVIVDIGAVSLFDTIAGDYNPLSVLVSISDVFSAEPRLLGLPVLFATSAFVTATIRKGERRRTWALAMGLVVLVMGAIALGEQSALSTTLGTSLTLSILVVLAMWGASLLFEAWRRAGAD